MLYKVSKPRSDMTFHPSRFWRTADWKSSSNNQKDGYIEETVLYAGDFDEVNIHLLPKVRRLRVWITPEFTDQLHSLGCRWKPGCKALLFASEADRALIEEFCPTIFTFARDGFESNPSNEYVARTTKQALSCETISMREAIYRWKIEINYVPDVSDVVRALNENKIKFSEQS